ncbi:MAG: hypothetical protein KAQ92_03965 [Candidatus Aenigmarchaeota archaeon]|nr:hypothetical protein [Candidatus Aenigmarchaeota archaeon]
MTDILGFNVPLPEISLTGALSSSWIYIFIICIIGFILIVGIAFLVFFTTYNRRVVVFENISGQGYQPVLRTRARIVKLGVGGEEILKTLMGGTYVSAYGRKMGKNTFWFAKGSDGYWYNIVLGDLDTKLNLLDIDPIDRDVRMFHVALDRLSHLTYSKQKFLEKYGIHLMLFLFLIVLIFGMWFIVGKVGDSTHALAATAETNEEVAKLLSKILQGADNIQTAAAHIKSDTTEAVSGIVPAS